MASIPQRSEPNISRVSHPVPKALNRASSALKNSKSLRGSMLAPTATINREQPLGPTDGDLHENLRPVLNMADRIGREVEQFAEELDKWDERRQKGEKRTAAIGLLDDCKKIAELTVKDLKKKYGSELSKRVGDVWTHRAQKLLNNQLDRKRDAEEIDKKFPKTPAIKDLERWQQEADTWELLQIILISNTSVYGSAAGFRKPINATINKLPNGEDVWEEFLGYNPVAKEQYLITKWLEATAEYTGNDLEIMAERLKESAGRNEATWSRGLLETRERIKSVKRLRPWSASELDSEIPIISNSTRNGQIVSSLDPDSKFRERLPLEGNDEFFERSLWLSCWELLRRGRPINEIREWCADRIENWRSVSLGPGTSADRQGMSRQEIFGRALWRRTCIMASKNTQASEYERAVYGLLGGNTSPVEAVCRNWNDLLYASFRTLLVDGFEDYARTHYPDEFPDALHRLPAEDNIRHFDQANPEMLSLAFIEDLLHEESVENEAKTPMKMMQGDFISHQFMTLVVRLGAALSDLESRGDQVWLEETSSDSLALQNPMLGMATDPNILRIMVHVVLILQGLDSAYLFDSIEQMQAADDIIIAYIEILKRSRKLQLIPLYASRLQRARPEMIVGRVLPVIETPKERHDYIGLLKSYDFNVLEVLTAQYESLLSEGILEKNDSRIFSLDLLEPTDSTLWPGQRVKSAFYRSELEDEEFAVIDSLEWFLLLDGHWVETFKILTKTLTTFLRQGRIASAVALCDRLPTKTISEIKTVMIFGAGIDIWSEENIEDLLQSLDSHRSSASRIRPFSPAAQQKLLSVLKSQSKTYRDLEMLVYALQALHDWRPEEDQVVEYERGLAGLQVSNQNDIQRAYEEVCTCIQALLKDDWLTSSTNVGEAEEHRLIRSIYLPPVILAYNSVLGIATQMFGRNVFLQSMELANIVASNVHDIEAKTRGSELAAAFIETGSMQALVTSIAYTSTMILHRNDRASKVKGKKPKKRGSNGETLSVWDPNAPMCPADES